MNRVDVACVAASTGGWTCAVTVRDGSRETRHDVTVDPADLERLAPGAADPTKLVERSFAFLLERELATSILRSFDLIAIAEYFPEYESTISRAMREA